MYSNLKVAENLQDGFPIYNFEVLGRVRKGTIFNVPVPFFESCDVQSFLV